MRTKMMLALVFCMLLYNGCIEKFWPDTDSYHHQLVVEGTISDAPGPYHITLSYTEDLETPLPAPAHSAEVRVHSKLGETYVFQETSGGVYVNNSFTGKTGEGYKLAINIPNGKTYESDFQYLTASPPIDSVYFKIDKIPTRDEFYDKTGLQFYLSTRDTKNSRPYYLWLLEETYQYTSDFPLDFFVYKYEWIKPENKYMWYTCYKSNKIYGYYTYDASYLDEIALHDIPLHFVSTETRKLSRRYSLLVKQYVIDEAAHYYYTKIKEMQAEGEGLYNKQPFLLAGNVRCTSHPEEKTLGYFLVSGLSKKRIFVDPPPLDFNYSTCILETQGLGYAITGSITDTVYISRTNNGSLGFAAKECFDCRTWGGKIEQPEFWREQ